MRKRLPTDAFEFYFGQGAGRSYADVAAKFGVSKKTVTTHALKERWQERIAERERQARENADNRAVETLDQMNERHLKVLQALQRKALDALRTAPVSAAPQLMRALTLVMDSERTLRKGPDGGATISSIARLMAEAGADDARLAEEKRRAELSPWMPPKFGGTATTG